MKVVVTPESCKGDGAKYTGTVEMRPPFIEERWALLEECGLLPQDEAEAKPHTDLSMTRTMVKVLMPKLSSFVSAVAIVEKESGAKLESLDDLRADPDATGILMELCSMLLKGFKPGKH